MYFTVAHANPYPGQRIRSSAMNGGAVSDVPEGVRMTVIVRPGARETKILGFHATRDAIRIDVRARAEGGAANRELGRFLTRLFGGDALIVRGIGSRQKLVLLRGVSREAVLAAVAGAVR